MSSSAVMQLSYRASRMPQGRALAWLPLEHLRLTNEQQIKTLFPLQQSVAVCEFNPLPRLSPKYRIMRIPQESGVQFN